MAPVPCQQETKKFREQAGRLVVDQQGTMPEATRRLARSGRTLERWVGRARRGQCATLGERRRPVPELDAERSRLTRELAEARMARDIFPNAPACVVKAPRPGPRG
jgi:transposase-like protein